jgi:hypothetical protein
MPPSQKETHFEGKDITNTISNISDSDLSTVNKLPKPRDPHCFIASKSPIDQGKGNHKAALLALPTEIRVRIYELLLISGIDTHQRIIYPECPGVQNPWAQGEILQTCKQIYHEANSILYARNIFQFFRPEEALKFIEQIGHKNFESIRILNIELNKIPDRFTFKKLFDILVEEPNGLGVVEYQHNDYGNVRGPGAKLDFIRTLHKIQERTEEMTKIFIARRNGRCQLFAETKFSGRFWFDL